MPGDDILDALVVGTGPAGLAASMALRRIGARFAVLDVGYDLEASRVEKVSSLASSDPNAWDRDLTAEMFPAPVANAGGVERRDIFGSDFPYRRPAQLAVEQEHCATELSHGLGGFGNVWGGAVLPYAASEFARWPVQYEDMAASYRNVLAYMPLSCEQDGLARSFPLFTETPRALKRSQRTQSLMDALSDRGQALADSGIEFGRARVAVDTGTGGNACRHCARCLEGCAFGSLFNPRTLWKGLKAAGVPLHQGQYVLGFQENDTFVTVTSIDITSGEPRQWRARRLILGAGHIATARIIARSLQLFDRPIAVRDSQYFFFPMLKWKAIREKVDFTLAEIFAEVNDPSISNHYLHFQVYGPNEIFRIALRALFPKPFPLQPVMDRLYLFQGFLHSDDSGSLELIVRKGDAASDHIVLRGKENDRAKKVARQAQALFRRQLRGFGIVPPLYMKMTPVGRSFHGGASFPMGGGDAIFASDALGRPSGLQRVHIADSACFPAIAGSTIAVTIMANADRIVGQLPSAA